MGKKKMALIVYGTGFNGFIPCYYLVPDERDVM